MVTIFTLMNLAATFILLAEQMAEPAGRKGFQGKWREIIHALSQPLLAKMSLLTAHFYFSAALAFGMHIVGQHKTAFNCELHEIIMQNISRGFY